MSAARRDSERNATARSMALSVALHAGAAWGLGGVPIAEPKPIDRALVEIAITDPEPSQVASIPEPTAVPEPAPVPPEPKSAAVARAERPAPSRSHSESPPLPTTAPLDLTGVTLTNLEAGTAWNSAANGTDSTRLLGVVSQSTPAAAPAPGPSSNPRPRSVPLEDLSRRPRAPDLNAALEQNYPPAARHGGLSGRAVVRAQIAPSGSVRQVAVVDESSAGFGAACRRTLRGSQWSPPLDRSGRAVYTEITYVCRFEVQR